MDSLQYILAGVDGENDLPAILLGIVVAYLTILISVAIAIFSEKKEFEALDRNVILDHIIKAKNLLLYLGLTFFPLLFWNGSLPGTRLLEIISWIVGIVFITKILIRSYHWMKGNKFRLRFGYLKELRNRQDMEEAWRSVWQTENINFQNEQEFFNIFHSTVNRSLENDER
jgi:amino acid transporter